MIRIVVNICSVNNGVLAKHAEIISVEGYIKDAYRNYLADYVEALGRDKVIALIQGQIDSIDHIEQNVFADSEGLMYNSIIWKEN